MTATTSDKTCAVCLDAFGKRDRVLIGSPNVCEHEFCLQCLRKWSKYNQKCPIDRQKFSVIHVKNGVGEKVIGREGVYRAGRHDSEALCMRAPRCELCDLNDYEGFHNGHMMFCVSCGDCYHKACLEKKARSTGERDSSEAWYCHACCAEDEDINAQLDQHLEEMAFIKKTLTAVIENNVLFTSYHYALTKRLEALQATVSKDWDEILYYHANDL